MFRLDDRVALVTGAGSGLGRRFALTLAKHGATVILAARRREKLEETAALVAADGGQARCVEMDVSEPSSVADGFAEMDRLSLQADVVVNNAGIGRAAFVSEMDAAVWDAVLDTNLKGVFLVAQAASRRMMERGKGGSIINIASILGLRVSKSLAAYSAAKAGVVRLTEVMAIEMARYGIRVNSISPGYFETDINSDQLRSEAGQRMLRELPMQRQGELSELDGPLLLLASGAGSFMTGSNLTVDGGHLCKPL